MNTKLLLGLSLSALVGLSSFAVAQQARCDGSGRAHGGAGQHAGQNARNGMRPMPQGAQRRAQAPRPQGQDARGQQVRGQQAPGQRAEGQKQQGQKAQEHTPRGAGQRFDGMRQRAQQRRERVADALGITEDQRRLGREAAREIAPIVKQLKPQARDVLERARERARAGDRDGARELLRSELRPLVEEGQRRARPSMQPLLNSLTPEQRAKLEAAAGRRGRDFDDERFARRLALRLALRNRGR
ncbi:MAG: hypothetical protein IT454_00415 [Planctomycetes bacterium]|nr:hypothetical protein [Planctomycetota bacterium]